MSQPTLRQQAGYLRRLLQRGDLEVVDPVTGRALPTLLEMRGSRIQIIPLPQDRIAEAALATRQDRAWSALLERLQAAIELEDAEELVRAVEIEAARREALRDAS